ncbi:Exosome complex component RRP42 [Lobulomyces angularis]|nr:Exosome complex component RRP42 [Lobulomyces angularis]
MVLNFNISPAEFDYIKKGIESNIRADGRANQDYRSFIIETNLINQASGSCRVLLDQTDILVGIKVEIGQIEPDNVNDEEDETNLEEDDLSRHNNIVSTEDEDVFGERNKGRIVCNIDW